MFEDNLSDTLIERMKQFAVKPNENLDQFRSTAAKLHSRTASHDKVMRERTLDAICSKDSGILGLLINLLETVRDQTIACSVAGILHECVAPKSGRSRSSAITQLVSMNATQTMVKLIMTQQMKDVALSDLYMLEVMWLLAQLAQRDSKFSVKTRLVGATKAFHYVLKQYYNSSKVLYPLLLVIKCLAKSSSTVKLMVKDGIVNTIEKTIVCIGFSPNSKLKLALNVLNYLTKSRNCCIHISKSGLLQLLLRIFERWERYDGKARMKICNYILITLHHLCLTKVGRKQVCELNGLSILHKFSQRCPEDKNYDPLLSRVCHVINICLERRQVPVESVASPATFNLPAMRDLYIYSDDTKRGKHEPSPGSDDDDIEEDDDDNEERNGDGDDDEDDDDDSCKDKEDLKDPSLSLPVYRDLEDLLGYSNFFNEFENLKCENSKGMLLKHSTLDSDIPANKTEFQPKNFKDVVQHELQSYKMHDQFAPYKVSQAKISSSGIEDSNEEDFWSKIIGSRRNSSSFMNNNETEMVPHIKRGETGSCPKISCLTSIADIDRDTLFRHAYATVASRVNSVLPFAKIAYPDMVGGESIGIMEPLNVKDRRVCRGKLITCVDRGVAECEVLNNVVYDLDALILEQQEQLIIQNNRNELCNADEGNLDRKDVTRDHLCFESRFESGNLRKAIQISPEEYNLVLMPDVNSMRHHQWFYFEVSNMEADVPYIFNIINCEKQNSQYNYGMRPIMYSVQEAVLGRPGWVRVGTNICYYRNCYQNPTSRKPSSYLTATFTITFPHSYDICYIAYHYPYTYSQLLTHIWKWSLCEDSSINFHAESLCLSLNNNETPVLTITASESVTNPIVKREIVFLTARVHPGESNSSWVMHGTIQKLLGKSTAAVKLRERFVFKIVPMLNMEGVINGCHRCGLTNEDLNRRWSHPNQYLHPVIYHTKGLLEYCVRVLKKPPHVFCDYHGHSRRKNVFLYGCSNSDSWCTADRSVPDNPADYLLLPHLMQQFSPAFALQLCSFKVERGRESTARVTVWREFGIKRSYTMESSYCGCDQGLYEGHHLDTVRLKEIGENFCDALSCLHDDSYWRTGIISFGQAPFRLDLQDQISNSVSTSSESDKSDSSEFDEEHY